MMTPPAVRQGHVSGLDQALQNARDVRGRLVGFVDHENRAVAHSSHQRRRVKDNVPSLDRGLLCQRLHRRVAVELDVLSWGVEQPQQLVHDFVLSHA
jgi:hypothetical protein